MTGFEGLKGILAATGAALLLAAGPANAGQSTPVGDVPGDVQADLLDSYIFVFADTVASSAVAGRAAMMTAAAGGTLGHVYTTALHGFSATMPASAAARIGARPDIAFYEADGVIRVIGRGSVGKPPSGGGSNTVPQIVPSGVTRVGGPVDGTGLTAWIIDTGVDLTNEDLHVDTLRAANFAGRGSANDGNGHGTHVAGIIAAIDNTIDVVGVAAGATVVPVRVLGKSGVGRTSDVIAGVDYVAAAAAPGDVANMSLGGAIDAALDAAVIGAANNGILFAIAAGNDGADAANYSPAHIEHPNVFTVSAINAADAFASFSNWGNPPVDFAAPGVNVVSLLLGGGTLSLSGTSMAAPHVAGVLLATFGQPNSDGCATGDPDGLADPIVHTVPGRSC